jgi:hypothetical protein
LRVWCEREKREDQRLHNCSRVRRRRLSSSSLEPASRDSGTSVKPLGALFTRVNLSPRQSGVYPQHENPKQIGSAFLVGAVAKSLCALFIARVSCWCAGFHERRQGCLAVAVNITVAQ